MENQYKNKHYISIRGPHGEEVRLYKNQDGDYFDKEGTIYPKQLFDPGNCGIGPFESPDSDPYKESVCKPHDKAFNRVITGHKLPGENAASVTGDLIAGSLGQAVEGVGQILQGAVNIAKAPVYILLGGVGGFFRYLWLDRNSKD